jgi:nitrate reductase gamma subunit
LKLRPQADFWHFFCPVYPAARFAAYITLGFSMSDTTPRKADYLFYVFVVAIVMFGLYAGSHSLSGIGLTFDIAGFLLLWRFGLPSDIKPHGVVVGSTWDAKEDPDEKTRFILAKWSAHISVLLVLAGFVLQFVGTLAAR